MGEKLLKKEIHLYYNRHKKEWFHKEAFLSDVVDYDKNVFDSINEIVSMVEYINEFSYTDIYNLINALPIKLIIDNNTTYLVIDFTDPVVQINKYDIFSVIHHQRFNMLPPLKPTSEENTIKSLNKVFIVKMEQDGTIKKTTVIYNYLFSFIKLISGIEYSKDIGTVKDYLSLADMNKI